MSKRILLTLLGSLALITVTSCGPEKAPAKPVPAAAPTPAVPVAGDALPRPADARLGNALASYKLGAALTAENVAFVPILAPESKEPGAEYLTLAEALEKKVVTVEELKGGGTVPKLEMESKAQKPVFVPFGAIVTGGNQDRMIRTHIVLRPGEKKTVEVYCVEQGRWSSGGGALAVMASFRSNASFPGPQLRQSAAKGESQTEVWRAVEGANKSLGNLSSSANFQGNIETPAYKETSAKLEPANQDLLGMKRVCGVVVVIDGKAAAAEAFVNPDYFRKVWPLLYKGYVVEVAAGKKKEAVTPASAQKLAAEFLGQLGAAKVTPQEESGLLKFTIDGQSAQGGAVIDKDQERLIHFHLLPKQDKHVREEEKRL